MVRHISEKSFERFEDVENCIVEQSISTRDSVTNLSDNFDRLNLKKANKPIPLSFLTKGKIVHLHETESPVSQFPHLFPK